MPAAAPVLTGLNTATTYVGVSLAPLIGQLGIGWVGAHRLGPIGAFLIALSLVAAETAYFVIRSHRLPDAPAARAA